MNCWQAGALAGTAQMRCLAVVVEVDPHVAGLLDPAGDVAGLVFSAVVHDQAVGILL